MLAVLSMTGLGACAAPPQAAPMAAPDPARSRPPGLAARDPGGAMPRSGSVAGSLAGEVGVDAIRAAVLADARTHGRLGDGPDLRVAVEAVTWGDGSLGCPVPGLMYTQALVPGWRLVVSDATRQLLYHASRGGHWVQCPAERARQPLPGSSAR
ncbi:MAG: hypothetical protein JNL85_06625 [Rubrivivax sp.]|nr:hypothetical protein [Rubrivivax sp.]